MSTTPTSSVPAVPTARDAHPTPAITAGHADRASDVLGATRHPLDAIFRPRSVAVVGATEREGSVGRTILWNLISSPFGGTVFPVNPARKSILGVKAAPSLTAIGEQVDLAVIVTPPATVPGLIEECASIGVRGAIIITAGFREVGAAGAELERQVVATARATGIRVVGPNCLGVMSPVSGLNATFAAGMASQGTRRLHQPERRSADRGARLERPRGRRASARSCPSGRCSTSAGATSSTTSATTRTPRAS